MASSLGNTDPSWLVKGDNAWQLTAGSLVALQSIPGLMLLYAGIVKKKWAINSMFVSSKLPFLSHPYPWGTPKAGAIHCDNADISIPMIDGLLCIRSRPVCVVCLGLQDRLWRIHVTLRGSTGICVSLY